MSNFNPEKYAPDYDWWDCVYEDAKEIGKILGFYIDDIYFSGFSCQGDGACFEGTMSYNKGAHRRIREYAPLDEELHGIADRWRHLQSRNFYAIRGQVKQSGHYSHSGCTDFSWEDERHNYGWTTEAFDEDEAKSICRDFMDWIYKRLEAEYEYQQAWELARAWNDLADEIKEERKAAVEIMRTLLTKPMEDGILKGIVEGQIRQHLAAREDLMAERVAIDNHFHYWQDGKSINIQDFAASHL